MKYLIATDIHGSLYYGQKIIDAFNLLQADKIILLNKSLPAHNGCFKSELKTIAKVSDTGLNEYGVVLFSGFYFVSTISFYANCFSMATNISSLLTLFLICVYLCALRRIKI